MEHWQQQNTCYICLNENLLCCSKKVDMNSDILKLLKFLIVNVIIEPLENVVGMGCLKEIVDACDYKYKNLKVSSEILKAKTISDSVESICQKCETVLYRNDASLLVDCMKHVDWLDFVKYLFKNPDMEYLEKSYICNSCQKSVSNIQHILKLLQNKIQYINNNCDDTKATRNKDSVESEVTIKEEIYCNDLIKNEPAEIILILNDDQDYFNFNNKNFKLKNEEIYLNENELVEMIPIPHDDHDYFNYENFKLNNEEIDFVENEPVEIVSIPHDDHDYFNYEIFKLNNEEINVMENEPVEIVPIPYDDHDYFNFNYENFKLKNEEIDLKLECSDCDSTDTDQSTHRYEKVEKGYEGHYPEKNEFEKVKKNNFLECEIDDITNQIIKYLSRDNVNNIENQVDFKHTFGTKKLVKELKLNDDIAKEMFLVQNRLKDNVKSDSQIFNCQYCPHKTCQKATLIRHIKSHKNTKDFECSLCSKAFTQKTCLDEHLFYIHKYRDFKVYICDHCNREYAVKKQLLLHKIKHGITDGIPIFKCYHCTFETYRKNSLITHIKRHQNIKDFKCTYCSKEFTWKSTLNNHLLRFHKCRGVTKKLYICDHCSCQYVTKGRFLKHKIKHGITDGIPILKCYHCTFETYCKSSLITHIKIHQNMKNFKCNYCSKKFTQKSNLNNHLLRIHKCRDVRIKLYNCDHCSDRFIYKRDLLIHKIKHGITDGFPILKCYQCPFETYHKTKLISHVKRHQNIKDFKCTYCSKEFTQKSNLNNHLLRFHKCRGATKKV